LALPVPGECEIVLLNEHDTLCSSGRSSPAQGGLPDL